MYVNTLHGGMQTRTPRQNLSLLAAEAMQNLLELKGRAVEQSLRPRVTIWPGDYDRTFFALGRLPKQIGG
jgi:hypothetical protein